MKLILPVEAPDRHDDVRFDHRMVAQSHYDSYSEDDEEPDEEDWRYHEADCTCYDCRSCRVDTFWQTILDLQDHYAPGLTGAMQTFYAETSFSYGPEILYVEREYITLRFWLSGRGTYGSIVFTWYEGGTVNAVATYGDSNGDSVSRTIYEGRHQANFGTFLVDLLGDLYPE